MEQTLEQKKRHELVAEISTISVEIFNQPMPIKAFDHLCDGSIEYLEDLLNDMRFLKELSPTGRMLYLKALMNNQERVGL